MNDATLKAELRSAVEAAVADFGVAALKTTSMFPLSRRRLMSEQRQAA